MCTASTPRNVPALRLENVLIGTAGWSIPGEFRGDFPPAASILERYSQVFGAVEINSSFYRPHRRTTYQRWAASVPEWFRFSVKMPKEITHVQRLRDAEVPLARFLDEIAGLAGKLGCILIQLPPSMVFDRTTAANFFGVFSRSYGGVAVIEPRHHTWFGTEAMALLRELQIDLVAADPSPCPGAPHWDRMPQTRYFRLHGTPKIYYSDYSNRTLTDLAQQLKKQAREGLVWCIFDNTAAGRATANAIALMRLLSGAVMP